MMLVGLSICVTVIVLNIHFRSGSTHHMSNWTRVVFLQVLPKFLCMKRPDYQFSNCKYFDKANHRYYFESPSSRSSVNNASFGAHYAVNSIKENNLSKKNVNSDPVDKKPLDEQTAGGKANVPICNRTKATKSFINRRLFGGSKRTSMDKENSKQGDKKDVEKMIYSIGCDKQNSLIKERTGRNVQQQQQRKVSNQTTKQEANENSTKEQRCPLNVAKDYTNHSMHPVDYRDQLDYRIERRKLGQLTIRDSFNSLQSLDEEESSNETINDQNNNYFDHNRLDRSADSNFDLDQLDNQLSGEQDQLRHHYAEQRRRKFSQLNDQTTKSIIVEQQPTHHDECSLCSPIELVNCLDDRGYNWASSERCTNECPNEYRIANTVQPEDKRQYSVVASRDRIVKQQANSFNNSIDRILLDRSTISQPNKANFKQYSAQSDNLPIYNQQTVNESCSTSVSRSDRSSIKRNGDETIFLDALNRIERNPHILRTMRNLHFLAEHTRKSVQEEEVSGFHNICLKMFLETY